mmetsp:Transcript_28286/g.92330  ORF Transcript_28286/g.92330 Transcript_28286/m.92330 type:complete len:528 (+) Transcript_28286:8-1591(+)
MSLAISARAGLSTRGPARARHARRADSAHVRASLASRAAARAQPSATSPGEAALSLRQQAWVSSSSSEFVGCALGGRMAAAPAPRRRRCCVLVAATAGANVLVVGNGGREHALAWKIRQSPQCERVWAVPGNGGTQQEDGIESVPSLDVNDQAAVVRFCEEEGVGLVVIGPEAPLVAGLGDALTAAGVPTFGPDAGAAVLEGSKGFMKDLCAKYDIPTAKYRRFTNTVDAKAYIAAEGAPIVVKADGLAAGKGVVVAQTQEEAFEAVEAILEDGAFGAAGAEVVVEEFLAGEEVSFFVLVGGGKALALGSAQDHKAVGEGDTGPNTGGMGAYSPAPIFTPEMEQRVMETIIEPTVYGMASEGCPFTGVLFAGLMIKDGEPLLLEYNVRFGDPECQVLMTRLQTDVFELLLCAAEGRLEDAPAPAWSPEAALLVVMAANGYPGSYAKGERIRGLEEAAATGAKVFHAGTKLSGDDPAEVLSDGGRVLGVTATGADVRAAQENAYAAVDALDWEGGFCRRDIGWRALRR